MKKQPYKLFVVRKYIKARSVAEAIRKERKLPVDDCWVDDDWKKGQANQLADAIGFTTESRPDDNEV